MGEEREAEWNEQGESDKRGQLGENKGELDEGKKEGMSFIQYI